MKKKIILFMAMAIGIISVNGEQIYVNPRTGNNANPGTKQQPVKTINEAARRVNLNKANEPTEVILSEGVHALTETALFNNNKYTSTNRLVIRAEIMPDDTAWRPQRMPIVITVVPTTPGAGGNEARGIEIEVNHATIEGIRFTGSPDYAYMSPTELNRSYPIWRDGKDLDDLLVTQCLFAGNTEIMPLHVGVIANGNGLVVDHCVFYNCRNSVVFWQGNGSSNGNAMHYCLAYGNTTSGVWTTSTTNGNSFDFHHNIIANCKTLWRIEKGSQSKYVAHDCIFSGNANMSGIGLDMSNVSPTIDFVTMNDKVTVNTSPIQIEMDQSKRNYLQLVTGSYGSELKAGLFKK